MKLERLCLSDPADILRADLRALAWEIQRRVCDETPQEVLAYVGDRVRELNVGTVTGIVTGIVVGSISRKYQEMP